MILSCLDSAKAFTRRLSISRTTFKNHHRFEHWYRDNTVYFLTARCRDGFRAFASEEAKSIFWDRFEHYAHEYGFVPWVTSLLGNHYHSLGYLNVGENLGPLMQRIHGSVAKLVNDCLPERHPHFWGEAGRQDYFDGCIRDEKQCRRAYRYTLTQGVRHRFARDWREYPHTRMKVELDVGVRRALVLNAFMEGVEYPRYARGRRWDK
jgi:hypothetical protein